VSPAQHGNRVRLNPVVIVIAAAVVLTAVGVGAWSLAAGGHKAAVSRPAATAIHPSPTTAAPAVFAGPSGVHAQWVIAENQRQGTTAWQIQGPPQGQIAGFANQVFARTGDAVSIFVSTDAPIYHVDAYRMGYYGGAGARLVWSSAPLPGRAQPTCPVAPVVNMVHCDGWMPSLSLRVNPDWPPGDYLLKLVGSGGQQSYVPLTVSDPASHAAYLIKNDVYTWQAWNPFGGYDFYSGIGRCPPNIYPLCTRARVVSFDRPYAYGQGAGDFLGSEYPLIRLVEQQGLDVAYATDFNVEEDPGLLREHRALLSLGHDECWSLGERLAAEAAERQGVNMVFFAASPVLRHVRIQPSPLGPAREVVDYRDSTADPLNGRGDPRQVTGNTWSSPPANWSEVPFVGEAYSGFLEPNAPAANLVIADASAWIFQGTGLRKGSQVPGVLVTDFDQFDPGSHPPNLQILAHSPIVRAQAQTQRSAPFSDMTWWTDPASGAGIFDSGINSWIPALTGPQASVMDRITENLLAVVGAGPAGRSRPASPNWVQIYP
jgi:hypothetical protein